MAIPVHRDLTRAGASAFSPTTLVLASDVTNNNSTPNTIADVTGLSIPVLSGLTYKFLFFLVYTSASINNGSRWSLNGPSFTTLDFRTDHPAGSLATRVFTDGLSAYDTPADVVPNSASTSSNIATIEGIIVPSANGNVIARFASELANTAIVVKAGRSYVEYQAIG